ncbi:NAD(P)H-binding protein [Amycolatopsis sp. NPDC004079]|uniref:SDR family oxidoreductase n=1 Tax=Amycolatopsis sp. NPDC004079 TaxID=3154549 RepID=UPI0033BC65EA
MILVTGATGNIGRSLVGRLAGAGAEVRALTRSPGRATVPAGVGVVEGDLEDPGSLRPALTGVEAIFLLRTGDTDTSQILKTAAEAGTARVVTVSSLLAQTHPDSSVGRTLLRGEQVVRDSGLEWTILRPWEFFSNLLFWAPAIRSDGVVRAPRPGLPSPAIDPRDIASVAASALLEDGHGGKTYPLTGPATLTPQEKIAAISAALGRPLRFEEDPSLATEDPADDLAAAVSFPGVCAVASPGALSTVEDVTGVPATAFRQWAIEHADSFR